MEDLSMYTLARKRPRKGVCQDSAGNAVLVTAIATGAHGYCYLTGFLQGNPSAFDVVG